MSARRDCQINTSVSPEVKQRLEQIAEERDLTVSQIIRSLVRDFLAESEPSERPS